MAQQHKRVQVFRARQEQKPQQESLGSWQDRLPEYLKQVIREGRQELARLQREDPAAYERQMEECRMKKPLPDGSIR